MEDASEDFLAAYQNAVVKMLFTLSASDCAHAVHAESKYAISASSPQPSD